MGHEQTNRATWNADADAYQAANASQIMDQALTGDIAWGLWAIPESHLNVLGDVEGKNVLELGCGAAQWSLALARRGARPVGLDLSEAQLGHARRVMEGTGASVPLVHASGEHVPFADASFDIVLADYGAFFFADPYLTVRSRRGCCGREGSWRSRTAAPSTRSPGRCRTIIHGIASSTTTSGCAR